jgi:O-antigen ligase
VLDSLSLRRPYPLLFALCVPLVFLHATYQPSATVSVGGSDATLYLSDVAVLAAGAVGLAAGLALGFAPLRRAPAIWITSAAFLALVALGTALGPVLTDEYPFVKHALTAAKFGEYALLALAAPLAIRTLEELTPLLLALVAWSAAATFGAVLQFLGLWNEFEGRRPGQREPSFLGIHDLAALSGAALSLGLIAIALGRYRRLGLAGGISGGLGMMLSGATTAVSGIAAAAVAAWFLGRRRALALAAVVAVVGAGVISIRAFDTRPLLDALGIEHSRTPETNPEASWQQRFALAYIGGRIFLDNPLLGVGWQASEEAVNYEPYVDDARRRFPDLPERALPSPEHPWGVQNGYVQAAADLGVLGLVAFLALFIVPLRVAWRAGADGAVPILWLLVSMGVWIGLGLVAGIPLVGLTWLSIGLAAASASWRG